MSRPGEGLPSALVVSHNRRTGADVTQTTLYTLALKWPELSNIPSHIDSHAPFPMRRYGVRLLTIVLGLAFAVWVWPRQAKTPEERQALREGRVIITYWDRHTGHEYEARKTLIDEFNHSQNRVYVRTVVIGSRIEKLLTAIAGGSPPDICSMGTTVLAQLAVQGCFTPLDDLLPDCSYLEEKDFFPHAWKMMSFDGHVWGILTTMDTMCLLWNKNAFRKAGLDPERPPRTVEELMEYAEKLTIRSAGNVEQYGFIPWQPWDQTFLWGVMFGGKWWDEETGMMTCGSDPAIIRSLAWQQSFSIDPKSPANPTYALDPARTSQGRLGGAYQSANNPFYTGKVAMITEGEWQCTFIPKYAPDLDWGAAPVPQPEGVPPVCCSQDGVADAIPAGSRHVNEAWEFLKWFYSPRADGRPSPASDYCKMIHNIPPRKEEALQERFIGDPKFGVFVNQLFERPAVSFPTIPAAQFLSDIMDEQREQLLYRATTPEQAAKTIESATNAETLAAWKLAGRTPE